MQERMNDRIGGLRVAVVAAGLIATASGGAAASDATFVEVSADVGLAAMQAPSPNLFLSVADVSRMMGAGAVGDFDNDGWPDVFVLSGGTQPDRLFMNEGGTFVDRAVEAGLADQHIGLGAAVGDYDGDGWQDIFVVSWGRSVDSNDPVADDHRLYRNNGDGTFTDVADEAGLSDLGWFLPAGWGPAFGDMDLDGDLDLAIPSWTQGGTRIFRNEGDGTFTDVSTSAGLTETAIHGFAARFVDMDGDRYPELLVAGDYGTSRYYRNDGDGTFTDVTGSSGTGLDGNGMGHAVEDLDNDGDMDWFVTSIFTVTGSSPSIPGDGNYLYRNDGDHVFAVPGNAQATVDGGWGWGVEAIDIDHDGRLDLVETNGWPLPNLDGRLEWDGERCYVWRNLGDMSFQDVTIACGLDWTGQGRGLVRIDHDLDGDQDVIIFAYEDQLRLYRNDLAPTPDRGWLRVRLDTSAHPRLAPDGYGARVEVRTGELVQTRQVHGGSTFASQSELTAHFGLGSAKVIDEIRVTWNDGSVTRMVDVAPNANLLIESGLSGDLDGSGSVGFMDLLWMISAYGQPDEDADLDADGLVDRDDVLILLANWGLASG